MWRVSLIWENSTFGDDETLCGFSRKRQNIMTYIYVYIYIYIFREEDGGTKGSEMLVVREFR